MTGNDIVDLETAAKECLWRRDRYLAKVFLPAEQTLISSAPQADIMVWLLWSMKEAAYKIHHRETGIRTFAPLHLSCSLSGYTDEGAEGAVQLFNRNYHTRSQIKDTYIHTVALSDTCRQNRWKAYLHIQAGKEAAPDAAQIWPQLPLHRDGNGLPCLKKKGSGLLPVSLSHHGRFTALVIPQAEQRDC